MAVAFSLWIKKVTELGFHSREKNFKLWALHEKKPVPDQMPMEKNLHFCANQQKAKTKPRSSIVGLLSKNLTLNFHLKSSSFLVL